MFCSDNLRCICSWAHPFFIHAHRLLHYALTTLGSSFILFILHFKAVCSGLSPPPATCLSIGGHCQLSPVQTANSVELRWAKRICIKHKAGKNSTLFHFSSWCRLSSPWLVCVFVLSSVFHYDCHALATFWGKKRKDHRAAEAGQIKNRLSTNAI